MKSTKARNRVLFASIVLAVAAVAYFSAGPIRIAYLAHRLSNADTPAEELTACRQLNAWEYWYSVEAFDETGAKLMPHKTGVFGNVTSVRIVFRNGTPVERHILNRDSLTYIYGE